MASSRRRGSTVLPLNINRQRSQQPTGLPAQRSALASQNANVGGDLGSALAPQTSVLGAGPLATLTPNIEAYAPQGAPDAGGGTQLIDTLAAAPDMQQPLPAAPVGDLSGDVMGGFGTPYGGPSGSPESDQALLQAEQTYGTPGNETPLSAATQESMLGSGGTYSLAPTSMTYDWTGVSPLLRSLLGL